jgi:hypothetical protein
MVVYVFRITHVLGSCVGHKNSTKQKLWALGLLYIGPINESIVQSIMVSNGQ